MIDLYYWPTPNGFKITLFLEEVGLPYRVVPVDIGRGDQFKPEFLAIGPNNRMPVLVDHEPADGGPPLSVFESGAILRYLGEKTGRFYPTELRARTATDEWLFWQMGGVGPMFGQANHFRTYAPEPLEYPITRYTNEVKRLLGVLDRRLEGRDHLVGEYTIADMASFPWVRIAERFELSLERDFPRVYSWVKRIEARPATPRALAVGAELRRPLTDPTARALLFGQGPKPA